MKTFFRVQINQEILDAKDTLKVTLNLRAIRAKKDSSTMVMGFVNEKVTCYSPRAYLKVEPMRNRPVICSEFKELLHSYISK